MDKDAKKKLFKLFDIMLNTPDVRFNYALWGQCFIAHYARMDALDKEYYSDTNIMPNYIFDYKYFSITSEQYDDIFCNTEYMTVEYAKDLNFHINRIKKYISDNNL